MSLILWLPLQGTLENKGISSIAVNGHSSTVDTTNGKLALSCQKFTRADTPTNYLSFPVFLTADSEFSFCCWFKTNSVAQNQCLYSQRTTGAKSTGFTIFYMGATTGTNADTIRFDDGAGLYSTGKISSTGIWNHVACVRTSTQKLIYLNGALIGSGARNTATQVNQNYAVIGASQSNAAGTSLDGNGLNGYLQDIRIYDHALSAAEIKELARGLMIHYKLDDLESTAPQVIDSSGYENHGTITGSIESLNLPSDGRYENVLKVNNNVSNIASTRQLGSSESAFSFNLWYNPSEYKDSAMVFVLRFNSTLMFNFGCTGSTDSKTHQFLVFRSSNYIPCKNSWSFPLNEWHMWTGTYDGTTVKLYKDGILIESNTSTTNYNAGTDARNYFLGSGTPNSLKAMASDIRIYATTLDATAIKELYETSVKIGNLGDVHTYEIVEGEDNKILKNGQLIATSVIEYDYMSYLKYDPNLYFEPDGSVWVHIYHHNAPYDNGVFTHPDGTKVSMDEFDEGIYLDEHRWLNMELCNYINKWEIITKRRAKSSGSFVVNRWIQPANPVTTNTTTVDNNTLNVISGSTYMRDEGTYNVGYNYHGYAHLNGSNSSYSQAYICAGSSATNWYGAIGARQYWSTSRKDTTSFNSTSTSNGITTGSVDLYLRIDNVTFTAPTKAKVTKYGTWSAHEIIEH